MSLTEKDLVDECELIQDDLLCVLDGLDEQMLDGVCRVIVDRIEILKNKLSSHTNIGDNRYDHLGR